MTKKLILLCETDAGFPTVVIVIFEISNVWLAYLRIYAQK
jgi:hypothetical protein